jgi:hypothetical protein
VQAPVPVAAAVADGSAREVIGNTYLHVGGLQAADHVDLRVGLHDRAHLARQEDLPVLLDAAVESAVINEKVVLRTVHVAVVAAQFDSEHEVVRELAPPAGVEADVPAVVV